jgi:hypothetical protein
MPHHMLEDATKAVQNSEQLGGTIRELICIRDALRALIQHSEYLNGRVNEINDRVIRERQSEQSEIPSQIRDILEPSLTEYGMKQWWEGQNRYLSRQTPKNRWSRTPNMVLEAANALAEGYYL